MQKRIIAAQKVITSTKQLKQITGGSGGDQFPLEVKPI